MDLMLVYVTVPDKTLAENLAESAIRAGLAAGANISGPCHSFYRWQGEIKSADEWQIFFQTGTFKALCEHLSGLHPHLTPCIIGMKLEAGHADFLDWIAKAGF